MLHKHPYASGFHAGCGVGRTSTSLAAAPSRPKPARCDALLANLQSVSLAPALTPSPLHPTSTAPSSPVATCAAKNRGGGNKGAGGARQRVDTAFENAREVSKQVSSSIANAQAAVKSSSPAANNVNGTAESNGTSGTSTASTNGTRGGSANGTKGATATAAPPEEDPILDASTSKSSVNSVSGEQEVLVPKSLLDSLTTNLRSIQVARSSWALKMHELQADMAAKDRAFETIERQLRDAQLERRGMALKLQQTEDALSQLQQLQQQQLQLLTSLQLQQQQAEQAALEQTHPDPFDVPSFGSVDSTEAWTAEPLGAQDLPPPPMQAGPAGTTPVLFSIRKETHPGENVFVVGNQDFCGNWSPRDGLKLKWTEGHVWKRMVDMPQGVDISFKMVEVRDDGGANWEGGNNRQLSLAPGASQPLDVVCEWDRTNRMQVLPSRATAPTAAALK